MMNSCRVFFLCIDFKSYCTKFKLHCTKLKLCCTEFKSYCTKLKLLCFNLKSVIFSFKQDDLYLIFEEISLSFIFIMPDLLIFKRSISHHLVFFPFSFNSFYCFKIKFCIKAFGCGIIIKNI